ncbi:MAG TPA: glycosyltransferase family 39 protein [Acidocella sp.]|uniref:glycosyltransferase family 39 protein n=1 Tax=Acidocella sp. TaxID=50710 RepID=UPI002BFFE359|nr:glycosyltransferase family 39 protein [Acidocella sp.]HVE21010.1 glycosyltransferase family 39 protein [Acidocella sp.]
MKKTIFLVCAALLLTLAAYLRTPEYDEAYSLFLTAGHARPAWPAGIFTAGSVRWAFTGQAGFAAIAANLKSLDVHPPLYFWALELWRRWAGPSWFAARMLSVAFSVASLALVGRIAALTARPVLPAMALTLLSYGFAYTGILARNFALAQCLALLGVALLLSAAQRQHRTRALLGGLALGAASFTHYLASFIGVAMLLWLALRRDRRLVLPQAAAGFGLFLLCDLPFFLAQRAARPGQFAPFSWPHALRLLVRDLGAALFGALPLYAGAAGPLVALFLLLLFAACVMAAWRQRSGPLLLLAVAPPAGLLLLGLVFGNTPIELRYLAFSLPFLALFLAPLRGRFLAPLLAAQSLAVAGLMAAPATMQPQAFAARLAAQQPGALALVPFGNDGVGVPGPFIAAAPGRQRIEILHGPPPELGAEKKIVLVTPDADAASRAIASAALAMLRKNPCFVEQAATRAAALFADRCADQHRQGDDHLSAIDPD